MKILMFVGIGAIFIAIGLASAGLNQEYSTDDISEDMQIVDQYSENCSYNNTGNCSENCYRYCNHNGNCECNGPCKTIENRYGKECSGNGGFGPRDGTGNQGCGPHNGNGYGSGRCRQK